MPEFTDRISNKKQASAHCANDIKANFIIMFSCVNFIDSRRVVKNLAGNLEADAVLAVILSGFFIVPLKVVILHENTGFQ